MPRCDAVGLVVGDMAATLRFYRMVGLDLPPALDEEPHVEVDTEAGARLMFDTEALIRSIDADWEVPAGWGRVAVAFLCKNPEAVNTA